MKKILTGTVLTTFLLTGVLMPAACEASRHHHHHGHRIHHRYRPPRWLGHHYHHHGNRDAAIAGGIIAGVIIGSILK